MLLLREKDLSTLLRKLTLEQTHQLLHGLAEALVAFSATTPAAEKLIQQPVRNVILTKTGDTTLVMPSSNTATTGVKMVMIPHGTGSVRGAISIFTPAGDLLGVLSAADITAFRTALATMTLLTRCRSLRRTHVVAFGAGRQVEWHVRLALQLLPGEIESVTVVNRGRGRLEALDREALAELRGTYPAVRFMTLAREGTQDYEVQLQNVLKTSDVVFCCTPSTQPLFPHRYLQAEGRGATPKQRFISLIGSYKPQMQEVDTGTLLSGGGRVWVDTKEACLEESGELIRAKLTEDYLIELGELYGSGTGTGLSQAAVPVAEGKNVIVKIVGMGIMDLVVSGILLDLAKVEGVGIEIDEF